MNFDYAAGQQLLNQLPSVLHIKSMDADTDSCLQQSLRFLAREAKQLQVGGQTIMAHLADILLIQTIRNWLDHAPEASQGWLAALRDKYVGNALLAIHREPGENWTVNALAKQVGLSRSGFSARFSQLVGQSVMQYVTAWRMTVAKAQLAHGNTTLTELSEQLGYQSEAAFSRAFKRTMGVTPAAIKLAP